MIIQIAIVEDDNNQALLLESYLEKFANERGLSLNIVHFRQAVALLENYTPNFDIVFMDIQLPYVNGMDAARKIRELDKEVIIMFITNLSQYAVHGYEVEALDYMVKPVKYFDFALKMSRAINKLNEQPNSSILISTVDGIQKVYPKHIRYVETEGHHVIYHTTEGEFRQYATMSSVEKRLQSFHFYRCNNCYLVNLAYVQRIQGYNVMLDGEELRISQPRKKAFVQKLMDYVSKKNL